MAAYEIFSVDRLIALSNHGDDVAEANRLYRDIVERLRHNVNEYGGKHKARLDIAIEFAIDAKGGIDVAITPKAKLPGRPVNKERFFLAADKPRPSGWRRKPGCRCSYGLRQSPAAA